MLYQPTVFGKYMLYSPTEYSDGQSENYDGFGSDGAHPPSACVTRRATTAGYDGN